jgi:hypothetical protein
MITTLIVGISLGLIAGLVILLVVVRHISNLLGRSEDVYRSHLLAGR